jgi:hypothetical protein
MSRSERACEPIGPQEDSMMDENQNPGSTLARAEACLEEFVTRVDRLLAPDSPEWEEWGMIDKIVWDFCHLVQILNMNCGRVHEQRFCRLSKALARFVLHGNRFLVAAEPHVVQLHGDDQSNAEKVIVRIKGVVDRCDSRIKRLRALRRTHKSVERAIDSLFFAGFEAAEQTRAPQRELMSLSCCAQ